MKIPAPGDRTGRYLLGRPRRSRRIPTRQAPASAGDLGAQAYNRSRLATIIAVVVSPNTELATMPGNVFLPAAATGLPRDSVVNVTAVVTLNKADLAELVGRAPLALQHDIDRDLRRALDL